MARRKLRSFERLEDRLVMASDTLSGIGLLGQYYNQPDFTGLQISRVDTSIDFDWGQGSPSASIDPDTFSVRWSGQVEAVYTESYSLFLTADEGARLWLDGVLMIDRLSSGPINQLSVQVDWIAGRKYDLVLEYVEQSGNAVAKLEWSSPSQTRQVIPSSRLFPSERGSIRQEIWNSVPGSSVSSLTSFANYPNNPNTASTISLFETTASAGNDYGQRLRGYLYPPTTGEYRFYVAADETAELWLSNSEDESSRVLIANASSATGVRQWDASPNQQSAIIPLVAGQAYYIEALHKESSGADHLSVGWLRPGQTSIEVIAGEYLSPQIPEVRLFAEQAVTAETLSGPATFSVVRSGTSFTEAVDIFYTVHGNAQSGTDYTPLTGVVTILPGQSTATISVVPIADANSEGHEQIAIELREGPGYRLSSIGSRSATAMIQDDREPPAGGVNLFAGTALSNFTRFGGTFSTVTVPNFGSAIQVVLNTIPANPWDAQLFQVNNGTIAQGDIVYAEFYVRTIAGTGNFAAIFERRSDPFNKSLNRGLQVNDQWQRVQLPFVSDSNYAVGAASFGFHLGYRQQTLQFAGFRLLNYGPSSNLAPPTGLFLNSIGGIYGSMQTVPVTGQSFSQAYRLITTTTPPNGDSWRLQAVSRSNSVALAGDQMRVQFYARRIAGTNARLDAVVQRTDTFAVLKFQTISLTDNWTLYTVDATADVSYAKDGLQVTLNAGFAPQTVEFAAFTWKNLSRGTELDILPSRSPTVSYGGRSGSDAWRIEANERIEAVRQSDLQVQVVDAQGTPVDGVVVHVEQLKHDFKFGSAINGYSGLLDPAGSETALKYQALIKRLFNTVVIENNLKWPDFAANRALGIQSANWAVTNGLYLRGHNIVWPSRTYMPNAVWAQYDNLLATQGATAASNYLRDTIRARVVDAASTFAGIAGEWDVVNEPYTNRAAMDVLGDAEVLEWYRIFREHDPNGKRALNDYDIFARNGSNAAHRANFDYWLGLLHQAGYIEVIGEQSHYSESNLTDMTVLGQLIDAYHQQYDLPIAITEFDVNTKDEQLQADYLRDYMTMTFSQPGINQFLHWGFWAQSHWLPDAALYRADFSIKPNGQAYEDLVFDQWWTDERGTTRQGEYRTRAFHGDYRIVVERDGIELYSTTRTHTSSGIVSIELPGVRVTPTALGLQEGAAGQEYSLVLNQAPTQNVTVSILTDDQVNAAVSEVIFTPTNWNVPQTILVTATSDSIVEGDHLSVIRHLVSSADQRFEAALPSAVTVSILDATPPIQVSQVVVGDGSLQRSRVDQVRIEFDGQIEFDDGAFVVERKLANGNLQGVPVQVTLQTEASRSIALLSFVPSESTRSGTSILVDGFYQLKLLGDRIRRQGTNLNLDGDGDQLPGGDFVFGASEADRFFAYFGDLNGDRIVTTSEFNELRNAFGRSSGQLGYDGRLDFQADGSIGASDFNQFRTRFGRRL